MDDWTYERKQIAHFGNGFALVPDQVVDNFTEAFPAFRCSADGGGGELGGPVRVKITKGYGDLRVHREFPTQESA